jgi:hypothetical protein
MLFPQGFALFLVTRALDSIIDCLARFFRAPPPPAEQRKRQIEHLICGRFFFFTKEMARPGIKFEACLQPQPRLFSVGPVLIAALGRRIRAVIFKS